MSETTLNKYDKYYLFIDEIQMAIKKKDRQTGVIATIYDILNGLEKKGFVSIQRERPLKYEAIEPTVIFKKEKDPVLSLNVRKLKLSYVLNELDKIRNNTNNINKESSEIKKYFLLDDYINNKLLMLIEEIAYEASLIYSNHDYEGGTN